MLAVFFVFMTHCLAAQTTVVSAASYQSTVSPGSLATLFGSNLALQTAAGTPGTDGSYPKQLNGTTVTVGGAAADLVFVSPTQISFVVPLIGQYGALNVVVASGAQTITTCTATVKPTAPAVFTMDATGSGFGAILNAIDFTQPPFNLTTQTQAGGPTTTIVAVYGTGFRFAGGTAVSTQSGDVSSHISASVSNGSGTTWALPVLYAGPAPGFEGLDQINVQLAPDIDTTSDLTLTIFADAIPSNPVYLWLRRSPGPTITAVSPKSASPGGSITISGSGFLDATTFQASKRQSVTLLLSDGTPVAAAIIQVSNQTVDVLVPAYAGDGKGNYYYGSAQVCIAVDSLQACSPGQFSIIAPPPTGQPVGTMLMAFAQNVVTQGLNAMPSTTDPTIVSSVTVTAQDKLNNLQQMIAAAINGTPQTVQMQAPDGSTVSVVMDVAAIQSVENLLTAASAAGMAVAPQLGSAAQVLERIRKLNETSHASTASSFCEVPTEYSLHTAKTYDDAFQLAEKTVSYTGLALFVGAAAGGCAVGLSAGGVGCLPGMLAATATLAIFDPILSVTDYVLVGTEVVLEAQPIFLQSLSALSPDGTPLTRATLSYPSSESVQFQAQGTVAPQTASVGDLINTLATDLSSQLVDSLTGGDECVPCGRIPPGAFSSFKESITSYVASFIGGHLLSNPSAYGIQNLTICSPMAVGLSSASLSVDTSQAPAVSVVLAPVGGLSSITLNASTTVPAESVIFRADKGDLLLFDQTVVPTASLGIFVNNASPSITTDRSSYAPTDVVRVMGTGFAPSTGLNLSLQGNGVNTTLVASLTALANGSFQQTIVFPIGTAPGSYQIVARSSDDSQSASAGITIQVYPVAQFVISSGGQSAKSGGVLNLGVAQGGTVAVAFDGSSSSGSIVKWSWQNNGTALPCVGSTCSYAFSSGTPNNTIKLAVTNSAGQTASATGQVNLSVQSTPPGAFTLTAEAPVCNQMPPAGPAVRLDWTLSANASDYDVYRNGSLSDSDVTGLTFNNEVGLVAGQTNSYFVQAKNIAGTTNSNTTTVTIPPNICQATPALQAVTITPTSIAAGSIATITITLNASAPSGGASVAIASNNAAFPVPSSYTVPAGQTSVSFSAQSSTVITSTTTVTVTATYNGGSQTATLSITVAAATPTLSITTTSLVPATATVGTGYAAQQAVTATGGTTPYSWSASGLPNGMAINSSSGAVFGTPTVAGTFNFTVTVQDSSSPRQTASKTLSITVAAR
ncbi:MAG: putative Ig domain-containing protein [Bryobacteraceae bacterium]